MNFQFSKCDLLKEYFANNYIDPIAITESMERNKTIKSLKLAYVSLSRPTHLMVIAISQHAISEDSKILEQMNCVGWKKYEQLVNTLME
jgi:DNA helicase II / ATP-dependent DNA helicase PcrA